MAKYNEQELIEIMGRISSRLARTFKFGYHEIEDMKQQAWQIALQGLEDYDGDRPLENFLWSHVRNRLYNFKRDNYFRPEKPCDQCPLFIDGRCSKFNDPMECPLYEKWFTRTEKRKALMSTVDSSDVDYSDHDYSNDIDNREIFELVDRNIPVELRQSWIRFVNGLKLPKNKRDQLLNEITLILKEHNIGNGEKEG